LTPNDADGRDRGRGAAAGFLLGRRGLDEIAGRILRRLDFLLQLAA